MRIALLQKQKKELMRIKNKKPKTWRKVKFGDFIENPLGGDWGQDKPGGDFTVEVYAIRGTDIPSIQAGDFSNFRTRYIKESSLTKRLLEEGDVVMEISGGSKGQPVGRPLLISRSMLQKLDKPLIYSNFCRRLRTKKENDPNYLYFQLLKFYSSPEVYSYQTQSTGISNFHFSDFVEYKQIPRPDKHAQEEIGKILSTFDDKIELNNKISRTLEQMARAIFKEWFVKLRFPGHEKAEFVDSELGRIPKGWEVVNVGMVLRTIESGSRPKGGVDMYKEGIPSIGAENIIGLGKYNYSKTKYVPVDFFTSMNRGFIKNQDVLLYKDGAEVGRKSFFMEKFPFEKCVINEHVFILRSNERISQIYLYLWLDRRDMTEAIKNLNANSAQPGINQEQIQNGLTILVPENDVVERFTSSVTPMIRKIFRNALENQKLASIRDLLLPKLMNEGTRV